jgi:hypothetical protein
MPVGHANRRNIVLHEQVGPARALSEVCTYLSYKDIRHLRDEKHLDHPSADVLEEYEESAATD